MDKCQFFRTKRQRKALLILKCKDFPFKWDSIAESDPVNADGSPHSSESMGNQNAFLKGSDDGVFHFRESCLWTLSIVQCFFLPKNAASRKLGLFPSSRKTKVASTLLGLLERASLSRWVQWLRLSGD
jgi:hypothetical protein